MNQHVNNLNHRVAKIRARGDNFGARDPTLPLLTDAPERRQLNSSPAAISRTRRSKKRVAKFDWDTFAIGVFLFVVAVLSLLAAHQLWVKLHLP